MGKGNAADARAYADEFTEDATCVISVGEALLGREAIERTHVDVLARWQKGTKMAIKPIGVRQLGHDVATVLTIGGLGRGRDDRWLCAAFQNTAMSRNATRFYNDADGLSQVWRRWTERRVS